LEEVRNAFERSPQGSPTGLYADGYKILQNFQKVHT
jgi:hypothetical protein